MNYIWHLCIANMKKRGIRTALTILGVVIGVISIVSLLALGIGVKNELLSDEMVGGNVTEVIVYGETDGGRKDRMLTDHKLSDMKGIEYVTGVYPRLSVSVRLMMEKYESYTELVGVPSEYLETMKVGAGALPDCSARKPEILMGKNVVDILYNQSSYASYADVYGPSEDEEEEEPPVGEKAWNDFSGDMVEIQLGMSEDVKTYRLPVSGMTESISYETYCDMDSLKKFLKQNAENGKIEGQPMDKNGMSYSEWIYSGAILKIDSVEHVDKVVKILQDMGYQVENNKEYVDVVNKEIKVIQVLLGGIGMIALVVAVIGIGNTMTTSVYDRINEIGILKVLGCDPDELLLLFLLESGILGGVGGLIGILLSYGITGVFVNRLAVKLMEMPKGTQLAVIPWWLAVAAFFLSISLGVLAGFFPARWAEKLKPIDAVRKQ